MNGHPPNRSGKGLRNASLNQQFIMTTSRNISWPKRKKETAGNNLAVSNFCVMDARLLAGVLRNVAGRVVSGVCHHDGSIIKDGPDRKRTQLKSIHSSPSRIQAS